MNLPAYLSLHDVTAAEFARRLGVSKSYFSDVLKGQRRASLDLAVRIERETKGAVTPAEVDALCPKRDRAVTAPRSAA